MNQLLETAISEIQKLPDEQQTAIAQLILRQLHQKTYTQNDLLKMSLADRQKILAEQAELMIAHYQDNDEILEWSGGDIVEYEDAIP